MAGILVGSCGYSATTNLPEHSCYLLGEPGLVLLDKQRSVLLSLGHHAELLDNFLVSLVLHTEPLDDLHLQCGVLEDHVLVRGISLRPPPGTSRRTEVKLLASLLLRVHS